MLSKLVEIVVDHEFVSNFLAIIFSLTLLSLVFYSVVGIKDADQVKATLGFSPGLLGIILGFYFNRGQLARETKERERRLAQFEDASDEIRNLRARFSDTIATVQRQIEAEPEE